ncbi:McrB family protein [Vibrio sp. VPAP30]|uniref:McrB family protein n=1 Tax=Vibrio sp. VPAP30 TaxID=1647102 RepID=UPI000AB93A7D|nr:AAA family ATPase [Vibrio sp. VPAP30]
MSFDYFSQHHVDLLRKWQGQKRDTSDMQQEVAYQELKEAYEIIERWAYALQQQAFPKGYVKLRKGPVNQGGNFFSYLWAKIYPTQNAPTTLAYTVHISTDEFAVKIETVNVEPSLVERYKKVRGEYATSPIVRSLTIERGLSMTLEQLIQWSVDAVREFELSYEEVAERLDLLKSVQEPEAATKAKSTNNLSSKDKPCNQILYGPPGTGKTYSLQQLQAEYTSQTESADASLWLQEKIAPLNWMQVLVLSLLSLGNQAKVADIVASKYFQTKAKVNNRDGNLSQTAWSYLQKFTVPESATVNYKGRGEPAVFDKTSDSVWQLLDDKLELVDELVVLHKELENGPPPGSIVKRYSTTTFHQSYGYEEFIEGLKATTDEEGNVHYSVEPGEFLKLCHRAEQDPNSRYAMFIDEINRGNISKIFGELISLVETDKRAQGANPMSVNLAYSGKPFSVPSNVDIIGAMNTADRSIALMDTALRRRFEFIEMMPDARLFESDGFIDIGNDQQIELSELLQTLNDRIEALYDREHTLGHAFFFPAYNAAKAGNHDKALANLTKAFVGKIVPLLQEYFHDDWSKIRLVLGDNQKISSDRNELEALQFVRQEKIEYQKLFGNQYEPDSFTPDEYRYSLADQNDSVWSKGEGYLAIYQPELSEKLSAQVKDES